MFSMMPWIAKVFPDLSDYKKLRAETAGQYDFMKKLIDEQYRSYDDNHVRHFLDMYFKEMKAKERNKYFPNAEFSCMKN